MRRPEIDLWPPEMSIVLDQSCRWSHFLFWIAREHWFLHSVRQTVYCHWLDGGLPTWSEIDFRKTRTETGISLSDVGKGDTNADFQDQSGKQSDWKLQRRYDATFNYIHELLLILYLIISVLLNHLLRRLDGIYVI